MSPVPPNNRSSLHDDPVEPIDDTEELVQIRSNRSDKGSLGLLTPTRKVVNGRDETSDAYFEHIFQEERELRERELALAQEKENLARNLKKRLSLLLSDREEEIITASSSSSSSRKTSRQTDTSRLLQHENVSYRPPDVSDGINRISAYVSGNGVSVSVSGNGNDSGAVYTRAGHGMSLRGVSPNVSSQRLPPPPPVMRFQPLQSPFPPGGLTPLVQQRQPLSLQQQVTRANAGVQTDPATEEATGGRPLTIERDETYSKKITTLRRVASSTSSLGLPCDSETSSVAPPRPAATTTTTKKKVETLSCNDHDNIKRSNAPKLKDETKVLNETIGNVLIVDLSNQKSVGTDELGTKSPFQQSERRGSVETTTLYNDEMRNLRPLVNEKEVEENQTSHIILSPMPHVKKDAKGVIVLSSTPIRTHMMSLPPHSGSHGVTANMNTTVPVSVINEKQKNDDANNSNHNKGSSITSYKDISGNQYSSPQYGVEPASFEPLFATPRTAAWYIPTSRVLEHSEFKNLLCGNWMPPEPVNVEVPPVEQTVNVPIVSLHETKEASTPPISPAETKRDYTPDATDYIVEFPHPPDFPVPDMPPPEKQRKTKSRY
ncbi:hypothetical protein LSM04_001119 [Trypanosoma melophagium]|uniref:uncharacterized protein n=1 Tax=Trypanosoma melophagium TaxID=715481 RepID=UPI00351A4E8E|nr:hypothetical protein LSM04_001119 [Trypanosoma melophagium]